MIRRCLVFCAACCAASLPVLAEEMSSAEAVATILNSKTSVSAKIFAEAQEVVAREAADGKPLQQFVIGVTTDDKNLAKRYLDASRGRILELAEKKDNPLAWYLLSMESNNVQQLRRAADGGNVQALNALGAIFTNWAFERKLSSNELERALSYSHDCFRRAAFKSDPNGFINLGTCYMRGFGCRQDLAEAFRCFRTAAEAGHPEGMENVSNCYRYGKGVTKNETLSLYWLMRARAARGDEAAENWLKERESRGQK